MNLKAAAILVTIYGGVLFPGIGYMEMHRAVAANRCPNVMRTAIRL